MLNVMEAPGWATFACSMAARSEPGPLSFVLMTGKSLAKTRRMKNEQSEKTGIVILIRFHLKSTLDHAPSWGGASLHVLSRPVGTLRFSRELKPLNLGRNVNDVVRSEIEGRHWTTGQNRLEVEFL